MFEPELYFCNDGVLRVKTGNKPMLPLEFIYNIYKERKEDTYSFMTYWMKRNTYFEEGLTVGKFVIALEPWAEFFKLITNVNVPAYIDEVKKPYLVKQNEDIETLDYLMIYFSTTIQDEIEFKKDNEEFDIEKFLNSKKEARLNGEFSINSDFTCSGYKKGIVEEFSVSHTPLRKLVNTPIFLSEKQFVFFENYYRKKILGKEKTLLRSSDYGVIEGQFEKHALQGSIYYKLEDVIAAFFDWMDYEPASRDAFNEELKILSQMAQEQFELEKNETPTIDEENEEETISGDAKDTDETRKISIMPGAFQPIIDKAKEEINIYETYLEIAKKDNSAIIRIGEIKTAFCEETRMKKEIISKPPLTKYKKI